MHGTRLPKLIAVAALAVAAFGATSAAQAAPSAPPEHPEIIGVLGQGDIIAVLKSPGYISMRKSGGDPEH